jgi:hypothetical protein
MCWWSSSSGRIELRLTMEQAQSVSHQGRCDDDVAELRKVPEIAKQLDAIDPVVLSEELREWGAWSEQERTDHDANMSRLLWLAGCDVAENPELYGE